MQVNSPFTAKQVETIAVCVSRLKTDILNVYQGFGGIQDTITDIITFVESRKKEKGLKETFVVGDFNVDQLKGGDQADSLISATSELGFQQLINSATMITAKTATCIDHV